MEMSQQQLTSYNDELKEITINIIVSEEIPDKVLVCNEETSEILKEVVKTIKNDKLQMVGYD